MTVTTPLKSARRREDEPFPAGAPGVATPSRRVGSVNRTLPPNIRTPIVGPRVNTGAGERVRHVLHP
jgi:hypothetical protein